MPAPMVVATLPMQARATRTTRLHPFAADAPATISFHDSTSRHDSSPSESAEYVELLDEAIEVARRMNCEVRRRCLGGIGGGYRWVRGRMRIILDVEAPHADRLAILADALRGEPRLGWTALSPELAAYLQPKRAA